MDEKQISALVFKPLKRKALIFGLSIPALGRMFLILAIGALLVYLGSLWTTPSEVALSQAEVAAEQSRVSGYQSSLVKAETLMANTGANTVAEIDLSADDRDAYRKAVELGITKDTTKEELAALAPTTKIAPVPVVPDLARILLFLVLPFIVALALQIEFSHGTNLYKELRRALKNSRDQHVYKSCPKQYLKRPEMDG